MAFKELKSLARHVAHSIHFELPSSEETLVEFEVRVCESFMPRLYQWMKNAQNLILADSALHRDLHFKFYKLLSLLVRLVLLHGAIPWTSLRSVDSNCFNKYFGEVPMVKWAAFTKRIFGSKLAGRLSGKSIFGNVSVVLHGPSPIVLCTSDMRDSQRHQVQCIGTSVIHKLKQGMIEELSVGDVQDILFTLNNSIPMGNLFINYEVSDALRLLETDEDGPFWSIIDHVSINVKSFAAVYKIHDHDPNDIFHLVTRLVYTYNAISVISPPALDSPRTLDQMEQARIWIQLARDVGVVRTTECNLVLFGTTTWTALDLKSLVFGPAHELIMSLMDYSLFPVPSTDLLYAWNTFFSEFDTGVDCQRVAFKRLAQLYGIQFVVHAAILGHFTGLKKDKRYKSLFPKSVSDDRFQLVVCDPSLQSHCDFTARFCGQEGVTRYWVDGWMTWPKLVCALPKRPWASPLIVEVTSNKGCWEYSLVEKGTSLKYPVRFGNYPYSPVTKGDMPSGPLVVQQAGHFIHHCLDFESHALDIESTLLSYTGQSRSISSAAADFIVPVPVPQVPYSGEQFWDWFNLVTKMSKKYLHPAVENTQYTERQVLVSFIFSRIEYSNFSFLIKRFVLR